MVARGGAWPCQKHLGLVQESKWVTLIALPASCTVHGPCMSTVHWAHPPDLNLSLNLVLQGSMGVPLGVGGVLLWAYIDWCPTGGSSLVRGSVRAGALHCQSTTQQWYCIAAALLRCICRPYRYTYIPSRLPLVRGYYHYLGCVKMHKVRLRTLQV